MSSGWSVAVRLQRTRLGWVVIVVQRFIGLDFGEIVGDCILDGVGARACMLGENSFSIWKTILSVSSRKVRQWRLRQSVLRRITD